MADTIIQSLRDYFLTCPLMGDSKINVDYLPEKGVEYSIDTTPTDAIIKRYVNGDTKRQYLFSISSIREYSSDTLQAIENSGFFEKLSDWMELQNKYKSYPTLADGKDATNIAALTTGYLFTTSPTKGRYQIQCRLIFKQKG